MHSHRYTTDLDALRITLSTAQARLQGAQEVVIEAAGDRICGSGPGPTAEQLQRLATARRRAFVAKRKFALLSATLAARHILLRLRRASSQRSSLTRRAR